MPLENKEIELLTEGAKEKPKLKSLVHYIIEKVDFIVGLEKSNLAIKSFLEKPSNMLKLYNLHIELKKTKKLVAIIFISSLLGACASDKIEDKDGEDNSIEIINPSGEEEISDNIRDDIITEVGAFNPFDIAEGNNISDNIRDDIISEVGALNPSDIAEGNSILQSNNDLMPAPSDNNDEGSNSPDEEALMVCLRTEARDYTITLDSNDHNIQSYNCDKGADRLIVISWTDNANTPSSVSGYNVYKWQMYGGEMSNKTLVANVGREGKAFDTMLEPGVNYFTITTLGINSLESEHTDVVELVR